LGLVLFHELFTVLQNLFQMSCRSSSSKQAGESFL